MQTVRERVKLSDREERKSYGIFVLQIVLIRPVAAGRLYYCRGGVAAPNNVSTVLLTALALRIAVRTSGSLLSNLIF